MTGNKINKDLAEQTVWYNKEVKQRLIDLGMLRKFQLPDEAIELLDTYYVERKDRATLKTLLFHSLGSADIPARYREYIIKTGIKEVKAYRTIWHNDSKEMYFSPKAQDTTQFWLSYRGYRNFNAVIIQPVLSKEEVLKQLKTDFVNKNRNIIIYE